MQFKKVHPTVEEMYGDSRDEIIVAMKTTVGVKLMFHVENLLVTNHNTLIDQTAIAKELGYTRESINKTLILLVKYNAIMETDFKKYLWNPYVTVDKYANAVSLQERWNSLIESKKYRRRGSTIKDDYLKYKRDNYLGELTMREFLILLNKGKAVRTHRVIKNVE